MASEETTRGGGAARPQSRAIYFWLAVGVFFAVLAVAQMVDPHDGPPVHAAEAQR